MNLRKTFFILPNLFTLSSVFCGFFAIISVASGGSHASSGQLYQAAVAICFGVFFDMADGRVARLTRTQSSLGLQLDSLADVITFGVAPALMMYRWGLDRITLQLGGVGHYFGAVVAFLFVACAALRLARFNVLALNEADAHKKPGKYIVGLPVPVAASVLVSLVLLNHQLGGGYALLGDAALAVLVVVLSILMVSRVRFRSFKDLRLSRRTVTFASAIVAAVLVALFVKNVRSGLVFVTLMALYVSLGLMEEVLSFRRRRLEALAARAPRSVVLESEGGARSDEEVLAELGAYDNEEPAAGDAADAEVAEPPAAATPALAVRRP